MYINKLNTNDMFALPHTFWVNGNICLIVWIQIQKPTLVIASNRKKADQRCIIIYLCCVIHSILLFFYSISIPFEMVNRRKILENTNKNRVKKLLDHLFEFECLINVHFYYALTPLHLQYIRTWLFVVCLGVRIRGTFLIFNFIRKS